MPIITREAPPPPGNPQPEIKPLKTISVDSKIEHRRSLLTHAEGHKWIIQYYSQVTTPDSEVAAQEVNRSASYQQYTKIVNFEVRVTDPLAPSVNTEGQEFSAEGSATVFPGTLIPLKGDMFIADIGDGRPGVFVIKNAEQLSILRDTGYRIEYGLKGYAEGLIISDLEDKVVKRGHFVKDFMAIGRNPILVQSEYDSYLSLRNWIARIPEDYFTNYFSHEFKTLLIPDQQLTTYDPFLTEFVSKIFSTEKHPAYMHLRLLNCNNGDPERFETIWDALRTLNERPLQYGRLKMAVCTTANFKQHPRFGTIRFSGINLFLQPSDSMAAPTIDTMQPLSPSVIRNPNRPLNLDELIFDTDLEGLHVEGDDEPYVIPVIHPQPIVTGHYVFSEAFYNRNVRGMSLLEQMVYKRLNNIPVDLNQLLRICSTSIGWQSLERFYYQPVLYVLVLSALGDIN